MSVDAAVSLLRAFYPGEKRPDPATSRDVYISASWHQSDKASAIAVCRKLAEVGFRLIGDSKDQAGFGEADRVERIIESCGAFVAIVPYRGEDEARRGEKPYKYFLQEIEGAMQKGIPSLVVADPRLKWRDGDPTPWLRLETGATECSDAVAIAIEDLWEEWRKPRRPQYVFYATDLESENARRGSALRQILERITGMPTIVGTEIHETPLQEAIIKSVTNAFLVVADISGGSPSTFNLDVCIEAGMARAMGTAVELIAQGKPRRPPFMLRGLQMPTYENEIDQLGVNHDIARRYRRRVINAEL